MSGELKPCPFCGGEPYFMPDDSYGHCGVGCHCEPEPFVQASKDEPEKATAAWNTRAELSSLRGEGEGFVTTVPDECDRIVWRGAYYHLASIPTPDDQP